MNSLESRSEKALSDYRAGRFMDAIQAQVAILNEVVKDNARWIPAAKHLCLFLFGAGDYNACVPVLKRLLSLAPDDTESLENLGVICKRIGEHRAAIHYLERAFELCPNRANLNDALAHAYSAIGEKEKAIQFGECSLRIKDNEVNGKQKVFPLDSNPAPFDATSPERNIIAFSLWGKQPKYLHGALRNVQLASDLYPGWVCRFYCDASVPGLFLEKLKERGAEIIIRPTPETFYDGLLWRFEVISDPDIDRYLIRDADSVINIRERVAVDEWLQSNRHFHVMRDYYSHTELILAGMWGGTGSVFPSQEELRSKFSLENGPTSTFDQLFLREMVWPTVKQSVLIHDRHFRCFDSKPFPALGTLPDYRHVGQNESALWGREGFPTPTEEELVALTS